MSSNTIKIKAGSGTPTTSDIVDKELAFDRSADKLYINDAGTIVDLTGTAASGDIEGVTAGNGLTGGGDSGTVTLNHEDTSSQASVNNSGRTYIQDITLDTYGHVTAISSATETVTDTNTNQLTTFQLEDGDGTEVTISHGKEVKFVEAGGININWTDTSPGSDADPYDLSFNVSTSISAGTGLSGGGQLNANRTLNIDFKDEDNMASNSASHAATQQSIKAYVDAEVAGIVNSAPAALDTLDELAAALGDDANFATTTSTSLGNRLRVDTASQGLTGTQQANAITNLGITATKAELNYVDGVTSNIQTQLNGKLTSSSGLNASNLTSGTVNNARLNTDMQLSAAAPRYKLQETGITNTPVWWMIADGGNYSIRLNNTGDYPISINTDSDNDAITDIDINYDIHLKATKKLYLDGGSDTYISETSADNLKFYVGGVNLLSMIEGGTNVIKAGDGTYLGVGDSTDFYMHHSTNSFMTNGTGRLEIRNQAQDQDIRFSVNDGGSTSNILTLNAASSRVGIGTTSPGYKLDVAGDARSDRLIFRTNASAPTADAAVYRAADNTFAISTNNTERMRIDSSGNVGIGSSSPDYKLDVAGAIGIDDYIWHNGDNSRIGFEGNDAIRLYTAGSVAMQINSSRYVGIGSTSPYERLYVQCEDATSPGIVSNPSATNGAVAYAIGYGDANRDYLNTWGMAYSSGANVFGYGVKPSTSSDEAFINSADNSNFTRGALYFDNELKFFNAGATTGTIDTAITMTERFRVNSSGTGHFDGDVVAYSTTVSDKRLKENITTIDNALGKVMALRGVEYDWTATSRKGTHDIGLVAQEVEEVIPELVTEHELCTGEFGGEGNEKTFKTVNYDKMVGVLIEAIKELKAEVEELKK
jgi:hypothetical protein